MKIRQISDILLKTIYELYRKDWKASISENIIMEQLNSASIKINENDLIIGLKYLLEKGYIGKHGIRQDANNPSKLLIYFITNSGIDYLEDK